MKFAISTWFPLTKNVSTLTPIKMSNIYNYNPHLLLLPYYFPAVAHWLKLRSYICVWQPTEWPCGVSTLRLEVRPCVNVLSRWCTCTSSCLILQKQETLLCSCSVLACTSQGLLTYSMWQSGVAKGISTDLNRDTITTLPLPCSRAHRQIFHLAARVLEPATLWLLAQCSNL
jgi:hypothetical protein